MRARHTENGPSSAGACKHLHERASKWPFYASKLTNFDHFPSFNISRAALYPGAPITPPPGCAPDPHKYRPRTGVR